MYRINKDIANWTRVFFACKDVTLYAFLFLPTDVKKHGVNFYSVLKFILHSSKTVENQQKSHFSYLAEPRSRV